MEANLMAAMAGATKRIPDALPLEEQISRRAYEIYVQRGNKPGSELDDWLQAEREILIAREQIDEAGS
jgi:hypothetical protein